ncbi:MAG: hypothetical protein D3908_03955, partial [Candidatus Electrothrix sp. AUS4]|nr:hypothetical protein [Candidatus Electrothrix sp. AUS4]
MFNQGIEEVEASGTMKVTPETLPQTYTVTAVNERGTYSRSVTLYQRAPVVTLTPSGSHWMSPGESVTLSWTTLYADTVTMNQGIDTVEANGSITITPDALPLTYTLTAQNSGGSTSRSVTLYYFRPTGTLTAEPIQLKVGDSTLLTWTSTHAETCTITPDINSVDCNG